MSKVLVKEKRTGLCVQLLDVLGLFESSNDWQLVPSCSDKATGMLQSEANEFIEKFGSERFEIDYENCTTKHIVETSEQASEAFFSMLDKEIEMHNYTCPEYEAKLEEERNGFISMCKGFAEGSTYNDVRILELFYTGEVEVDGVTKSRYTVAPYKTKLPDFIEWFNSYEWASCFEFKDKDLFVDDSFIQLALNDMGLIGKTFETIQDEGLDLDCATENRFHKFSCLLDMLGMGWLYISRKDWMDNNLLKKKEKAIDEINRMAELALQKWQ